jgi:hypothetical protein
MLWELTAMIQVRGTRFGQDSKWKQDYAGLSSSTR